MKLKISLILGLISLITSQANAWTVTIQGGGNNQRFDYITCTRTALVCRGHGSLICPAIWTIGVEKGISYPIPEIISYVSKKIERGEKSGSTMYSNSVPLKWESIEDGFQFDIEVDEILTEDHD